ncbi:hypothetical protein IP91_01138 [Pseudoduganella lurida]|uniref:Uncharacterized protein n=1 Tax=Pseudoduganella lurida TaxID=1036180 RepID=A0A562RNT4_9BURK|nr:hypothetical protein [Pseudoduganella lurida]TWI70060.1 hypothetical protein IP91_01138 [Pseudoduganella lurida]
MARTRPACLQHTAGIGIDRMGALADRSSVDMLRLENLDTAIPLGDKVRAVLDGA